MRICDLKVEHIDSNFKDFHRKFKIAEPKPEIQYNPCIPFKNILDLETKKLEDCK